MMSPHAVPALRLLVPFVVGMALANWLQRPLWGAWGWLILATGIAWWWGDRSFDYERRHYYGVYAFVWVALLGYVHYSLQDERRSPHHFVHQKGPLHYFTGVVQEPPVRGSTRMRICLEVSGVGTRPDSLQPCHGRILLYWAKKDSTQTPGYGDLVGVRAAIRTTQPPANPDAFDYQRYLYHQNIHHQAFVTSDSLWFLSSGHGKFWWHAAYNVRDQILSLLRQHFPQKDAYAVASALLVGYKDELSDELRAAYTDTGSIHALVVSGSHVSALMLFVVWLLRRLPLYGRKAQWAQFFIGIPLIWAFALLTGATASVIRAVVMFSLYLTGNALWRDTNGWNILSGSALLLLFFHPAWLFDAGFQLSYAAVAGMLFFYPRFERRMPVLPSWVKWITQPFLLGCAAQLGTLPLSLYYFHQFPVYFWLSGWVVMLGGTLFLGAGALLVLVQKWAFAANIIGWLMYQLTRGINAAIFFIQDLPGSVLENIWISASGLVLLFCMVVSLGALIETRRGYWLIISAALFGILGAERFGRMDHHRKHAEIVVYQAGKTRLIDLFDGDQCLTLSDSIDGKRLNFIATNKRIHAGCHSPRACSFGDTALHRTPHIWLQYPFIGLGSRKVLLLDGKIPPPENVSFPSDISVVIFSNNVPFPHHWCQQQFPQALWVFDATNSYHWRSKRVAQCRLNHPAFHDISEQGAWMAQTAQ